MDEGENKEKDDGWGWLLCSLHTSDQDVAGDTREVLTTTRRICTEEVVAATEATFWCVRT